MSGENTPLLNTPLLNTRGRADKKTSAVGGALTQNLVGVACVAFGVAVGLHSGGGFSGGKQAVRLGQVAVQVGADPAPPVHVTTLHMRTSVDEKHDQYGAYDTTPHEFHQCLQKTNNTPSDPAFAKWTSDGQAKNKLDQIKSAVLLDPIGKMRENGTDVKVYDATYQIDMVDHDGHEPINTALKNFTDTKKLAEAKCTNPIGAVVKGGYLNEVSGACEERLLTESNLVYTEYQACNTKAKTALDKLVPLKEWHGKSYALKSDGAEVERLYQKRKKSGKAYDDFFDKWLTAHNDGLAACAYSANQMSFVSELEEKFLSKLDEEKASITSHCANVPTMQPFEISEANVNPALGAGDDAVPKMTPDNPCYAAIEAINGLRTQSSSRETTRSQCLEFYCEKIQKDTLPAARTNAETAKTTYDEDDANFNTAYLEYTKNYESYIRYRDAVKLNVDFVHDALELATGSMEQVAKLRDDLIKTASCEPSTICCQKAEVIPEICHRNANGTVATFLSARDVNKDFTLSSSSSCAGPISCAELRAPNNLDCLKRNYWKTEYVPGKLSYGGVVGIRAVHVAIPAGINTATGVDYPKSTVKFKFPTIKLAHAKTYNNENIADGTYAVHGGTGNVNGKAMCDTICQNFGFKINPLWKTVKGRGYPEGILDFVDKKKTQTTCIYRKGSSPKPTQYATYGQAETCSNPMNDCVCDVP